MRKIDIRRDAAKFVERLPPKHRRQVALKLQQMRNEPQPPDARQLQGELSRYMRTDSGEYRIIYTADDEWLRIYLIGKRNDDEVYRRLRRLP